MPYKIYSYKGKFRVCKPGGKKCFSKKGLSKKKAEAQQKALYASENVKESLSVSKVGTKLEFKMVMPPFKDQTKCSVLYKVLPEAGTDLIMVYALGDTAEDTKFVYFALYDHNDLHGKPHIEEDMTSEETQRLLKTYRISPVDVQIAKDDGYDRIEERLFKAQSTLKDPYEESLNFEQLAELVLAE